MGGGHHITRDDYDRKLLIKCIKHIRDTYGVEVYLEPGEAIALNAGYLVTEVMDIVENGLSVLILDASAACHMPDVLEMPYRPPLKDSGEAGEKAYTYRLGGPTCLAGDIIGDYSFDAPLKEGDKLVFEDMAIYTMVKNNTFNGIGLPAIALTNHAALSSAFANDVDGMLSYAQQVNGYGKAGDVFLGISTSGNAENVMYAAVTAKAKGMKVIGLTGKTGGKLAKIADVAIIVPEQETYKIQELHLPIYHALCLMLEDRFYAE